MTIPAQITFSQQFLLDSLSSSRSTCSTRALVQPSSCAQSVDFIAGCSTSSLLNIYYSVQFNLSICFLIFWQIYFYRPCASISHPILCYNFSALHVEHLPEYTFRPSFGTHLSDSVPNNRFTYRRPLNANACFFRTLSELISLLCALKKLHTHPIFPFRFHTLSSELFRISVNSNSSAASYFDEPTSRWIIYQESAWTETISGSLP